MSGSAAPDAFDSRSVILGPRDGRPRLLHTMLRVRDLGASLRFYVEGLGMKELERVEIESRRLTSVFVGFNEDDAGRQLELSAYWDREEPYSHGSGYGHVAISVADVGLAVAKLEALGGAISQSLAPRYANSPLRTVVKDPDGYDVLLVGTGRS